MHTQVQPEDPQTEGIHTRTHTHAYIHTHTHTYIHKYMHAYTGPT